jgi:hypothetical protein
MSIPRSRLPGWDAGRSSVIACAWLTVSVGIDIPFALRIAEGASRGSALHFLAYPVAAR